MSDLSIPESWAEIRLGEVLRVQNGYAFKAALFSSEFGTPLIRIRDLKYSRTETFYTGEYNSEYIVKRGDLLIGMDGNFVCYEWLGEDALLNQRVCRLICNKKAISNKFVLLGINRELKSIQERTTKVTVGHLSSRQIEEIKYPYPPRQEQERIVQKIESCFAKIDATEANLNKVETLLEKYRESLLAKAFRGELVPQDPNDEPASVLLERIRKERSQNAKGKKAEQEFAPIADEDKPFELPNSWIWIRANAVCLDIQAGSTPKSHLMTDNSGDIQFIKVYNLNFDGTLNYNYKPVFVSKKTHETELARSASFPGDVLMNIVGPPFGKISIIPKEIQTCNHNQAIVHFRCSQALLNRYLALWLQSPFMNKWMMTTSKRTAGQWNLSVNGCRDIVIPLPPINEQIKILTYIEQRMQSLYEINRSFQLIKNQIQISRNSILNKAFEGRLVEQIPSEGTGHELLAKILAEKEAAQKSEVNEKSKKNIK